MGRGFWLNPGTGQCVQVATTHDDWIRQTPNADRIGLPDTAYEKIMQFPATAVDEIRLAAMDGGLVRIREHPRYTSVQFRADAHRVASILAVVSACLRQQQVGPDTVLRIDNLLLGDSAEVTLAELIVAIEKGAHDDGLSNAFSFGRA